MNTPQATTAELTAVLGKLGHFKSLDPSALERVAACCSSVELKARETLFQEGERCDAFFVLTAGALRVARTTVDGREQVLHHVSPGRSFAEVACLHLGVYPATATAEVTPTRVVRVSGRRFRALLAEVPEIAPAVIGSLCGWLHSLVDRIDLLLTDSAGARLARYLLQLPAHDEAGVLSVQLPVAKKTLAGELSITPETLSRLLARWRKLGVASSDGARIELLDVRALETLAADETHSDD
ncbi:MAG: Crp/Fnr family transcriptional regulator [Planctomycetota bacterium]|nr:MAG: Crp/Fnr family transcriptional regulator [Planctomycetota bacterium]